MGSGLAYAATSDPLLAFAFASGLAVWFLTLVLLVAIVILRYSIDRRQRLARALTARWQPVFFHAVEGLPFSPPPIAARDGEIILLNWLHFTESTRGEARQRLVDLALSVSLDSTARQLMKRRNPSQRLLAIAALGRLKSVADWSLLAPLASDPNPILSLLAARSLLQIDAARALPQVLDELVRREDWPSAKIAAMLAEAPEGSVAGPLLQALRAVTPANAQRLLGLLDAVQINNAWPVLAPLLDGEQPVEMLTAALKVCRDPRALESVRRLAAHAQWVVRAQAATALGRLGTEEDGVRLQALLSDPEWWVRYRAALALAALPGMPRETLVSLCARLPDHFAADIMRQILAETMTAETA